MEQVEQINIETLKPYTNNARVHNKKQIGQIADSIKSFGFNNPILIDQENNIIAGHGRVEAAKQLNMETVPTLKIEHLSETEKKAYILADNKIQLNSDWDSELLREEIAWLNENNFDLTKTGFSENELTRINKELNDFYSNNVDKLTYEPINIKPQVKELYDDKKTKDLIKEIENSNISEELKKLLTIASYRHTILNFDQIAEYYCHANKEEQELIEKNALVVIDFKDAVNNSYINLSEEINALYIDNQND